MSVKPNSIKQEKRLTDACRLPNGCHLYYKDNEAGGRTYWSDEIGGGVMVWDTCLVDQDTLLAAIVQEGTFRYKETINKCKTAQDKLQQVKELVFQGSPLAWAASGDLNAAANFEKQILDIILNRPTTEQLIDEVMPDKVCCNVVPLGEDGEW
jgi:hypothetical protein